MTKTRIPLKKRIALNIFNKYYKTQCQLHDLRYLFWECTLRCNLNCLHCGSDCKKDPELKDMPAKDFLDVTKKLSSKLNPNKCMIVITGGEPLLRKDLEEVGLELYKQGYPWGFVSNGLALTAERLNKLMRSGLRSLTISLDGLEDSHNWLRGRKDSYEKAKNAIALIAKEKNLVYDVVSCVNQRNFHELKELRSELIRLGVKKWRVFTIFPIGRAAENQELDVSNQQFRELMDFIVETRKEGKIHLSYGCEGFLGNYENQVRDGFFFCHAGINIGSVLVDGAINACPNNNKGFNQGNIYSDDFWDVWDQRFQVFRDRSWAKSGDCKDCKEFKWCHGNGMHLRSPNNDKVMRCHYKMLNED